MLRVLLLRRHAVPTGSERPCDGKRQDLLLVRPPLVHGRHMDECGRALMAVRLATLGEGRPTQTAQSCAISQNCAAELLNVSRRSLQRESKILDSGSAEMVDAVEQGLVPVSLCAKLAQDRFTPYDL